MTKPTFDVDYNEGPSTPYIDWVAGGNFDGYIQRKSIRFSEANNQVRIKRKILDQTRFDGTMTDSEIIGKFEYTSNDTITVWYEEYVLRGKILGKNQEFIAFSVAHPHLEGRITEVYQKSNS